MAEMKLLDWQVSLAEHQTRVLRKERAMLSACHTGAGKTYLAAQTIRDLGLPTLVVCPKVARSQWRKVLEGMGASHLILDVVNPESLIASVRSPWYNHDDGWKNVPQGPALLVYDELHRGCSGVYVQREGAKKGSGKGSKTPLAVARWVNKSTPGHKVLALTATPASSPLNMQTLGYLMGFHSFLAGSFYQWCREHGCDYVDRRGHYVLEFTRKPALAASYMAQIRRDMGERFLSIGPDDIPGFPEETKEVMLLDLDAEDHAALVRAYEEMPSEFKDLDREAQNKLLRLRQQAEFAKAEAVAKRAVDLESDGYSVFVMLNFTDARLRLEKALAKAKVPFASIYGGQKDSDRQAGIDAFQDNRVHVMVGMAQACSVALSLHDERRERPRVSLISPGYSVSEMVQGLGRIRRVGGTHATQYIVIAAHSVEEKVGKAIERKLDNLAALTDAELERKI